MSTKPDAFDHGYALLIGVNMNCVQEFALSQVAEDVSRLSNVLGNQKRCGYKTDNVIVIKDEIATKKGINAGFKWLEEKIARDDNNTVLVYFSGHGYPSGGSTYLVPYDLSLENVEGSCISASYFSERIASFEPRRLLVILDCCHAAGVGAKGTKSQSVKSIAVNPQDSAFSALYDGEGRYVLSSSKANQKSFIRPESDMSIFTYHLIEALYGKADTDSETVLVTDLVQYVAREVPKTAKRLGESQVPVFSTHGEGFPIALAMGGLSAKGGNAPDPAEKLHNLMASVQATEIKDGAVVKAQIIKGNLDNLKAKAEVKSGTISGKGTTVVAQEVDLTN